jgi:hypothetical protein
MDLKRLANRAKQAAAALKEPGAKRKAERPGKGERKPPAKEG